MSPSLSTATLLALLFSSIAVLSNAQLGSFRDRPIEVRQFSANFTNFVANYSMLVPSEADGCPQGTLLMVAVLSKRSGWDRRNFIRQTYGRHLLANQVLKFVVGKAPSGKQNATEDILLAEELHRFGDIFFYGLEDSYDNLPLKVLALMQWQQAFCQEAKFLLKIDDDVLADLPRLGHWLERKLLPELAKKPKMIFGHVLSKRFGNAQLVIRDPESKWRLSPEDFPDPLFPDYVDGPAYLVSSAAVQAILEQVPKGRFIRIEDALFTGIFRERAGVGLSDQEPFIQIYCGLVDCPGNTPSKPFVGPRFNVEDVYNRIEQNYKANWNDSRPVQRLIRKEMNARGTELNCRLDLQKRCSGQVPITSIWCPGDKMRTLADYTALYAELHSIKCENPHPETR